MLKWQMHAPDEWRFGEMIRGAVRTPYYAEVCHSEGYYSGDDAGWLWYTNIPGRHPCPHGKERTFDAAITAAEKVLLEEGILQ